MIAIAFYVIAGGVVSIGLLALACVFVGARQGRRLTTTVANHRRWNRTGVDAFIADALDDRKKAQAEADANYVWRD